MKINALQQTIRMNMSKTKEVKQISITYKYVNNKDFLQSIIEYKKACRDAKNNNKPKPRIPEYAGKCILLIAENLSHKLNFNGYSFKDEMQGDGIENCIMYFDNFNPRKYKNPFAYFTQIIYYAFLRRILKEKKQLYTRYVLTQQFSILGDLETPDNDDGTNRQQFELYENISDFIGKFEDTKKRKKKKAVAKVAKKKLTR
jgi:hypothetical protein